MILDVAWHLTMASCGYPDGLKLAAKKSQGNEVGVTAGVRLRKWPRPRPSRSSVLPPRVFGAGRATKWQRIHSQRCERVLRRCGARGLNALTGTAPSDARRGADR